MEVIFWETPSLDAPCKDVEEFHESKCLICEKVFHISLHNGLTRFSLFFNISVSQNQLKKKPAASLYFETYRLKLEML